MSIRLRLALFGLGVVAATLIAFITIFYGLFAAGRVDQQDRRLAERAEEAVAALATEAAQNLAPLEVPAPVDPATSVEMFVIVIGANGTAMSSTGEVAGSVPALPADLLAASSRDGEAVATIEPAPGVRLRIHLRPWSRPDLELSGHVAVAQSTRAADQELSSGTAFLIVAGVFAFLVAAGAIWLVIGRALRPLRQLAALTDDVGRTQDLSRRLPVPSAHDDLRRLSESFNGMMTRLEEAYVQLAGALESQKRFVADASHELRTPLTSIRSNAGFLIQHPDARAEDRDAALDDIASEGERMSRMVHDLLTLARADAGQRLEMAPFDFGATVREVARQARTLHPDRNIHASVDDVAFSGNQDGIKQLLWILIDNSARHTGAGGQIRIALEAAADGIRLVVADDGEGIAPEHLERIFDRFYQVQPSRTDGGAGLGLSIARWIAHEHGARIFAANNGRGGATFYVELPGGAAKPATDDGPGRETQPVPDAERHRDPTAPASRPAASH